MSLIQTLLLTGTNNHDWRRSAPFIKSLLENTGKFLVDLTENPSDALSALVSLKRYDLLLVDYNGPDWSDLAKSIFEEAIRGGTGLCIVHASNNAFTGWMAYEEMMGVAWREGTGHGEFHEFTVEINQNDHPITRTLATFTTWDELYHRLVHMHGVPFEVLATAYSDPHKGGTGEQEPVAVVRTYGDGRVFHLTLGHVWPGDPNGAYRGATMIAFENKWFQSLLLRGCEWAATGDVTEP